ncbi:hypothetical protein EV1_031617 [Malus domestica]
MEEDFEIYNTDNGSIWSQIKHQEKQIQLKRRWLLGLPASNAEQKKFENPELLENKALPESFLREDDMFYEVAKSCVDAALGGCEVGGNRVFQDDIQLFDTPNISRVLSSCLDDLTNKGLYLFALKLTGGSAKFEKTRWKMKRVIRESLPKVFGSQDKDDDKVEISQYLSQLLNDPQYFRDNFITVLSSRSQSNRAAARKLLDRLPDMPLETLIAMNKKLRGRQSLPQLLSKKSGWNRDRLINQVRETSEEMLTELGIGDELQQPLARALAVVGLSLKLIPGFHNSTATEFHQFSPEIKILQDEIARAIWLVKTKITIPELKNLKILLDPNAKVSNRSLRRAIRKMLTEFLFECGDMDTIPKSLLEALVFINRNSQSKSDRRILKDEIEEEVECILNVSAQIKQVIWDTFPDHDLDVDFSDAYMEEMEESDDNDDDDDGDDNIDNKGWLEEDRISGSERSHSNDSYGEVESTGESMPSFCKPPTANTTPNCSYPLLTSHNNERLEHMLSTQADSVDCGGIRTGFGGNFNERHEPEFNTGMDTENSLHLDPEGALNKQTTCKNEYLAVQEVCDETSMIAYNFIGHMLDDFAQREGLGLDWDDCLYLRGNCAAQEDYQEVEEKRTFAQKNDDGTIIVRVIEDLIPSFPKSGIEALKKLMGLL